MSNLRSGFRQLTRNMRRDHERIAKLEAVARAARLVCNANETRTIGWVVTEAKVMWQLRRAIVELDEVGHGR